MLKMSVQLFSLPSSLYLFLHHLISIVHASASSIYFLCTFSDFSTNTKPLLPLILGFHTFPNSFIQYWGSVEHLSSYLHILCSTSLPVCCSLCLYASASIESPSVPIHHALHFSLLAGINHKYFIIHHGRLSHAHPQFITAALSAGLPRWL